MSSIPIKLDPGLVSNTFKDPFQVNPENMPLYSLISRIDHERQEQFLGLNEQILENEAVNERIESKMGHGVDREPRIFEEIDSDGDEEATEASADKMSPNDGDSASLPELMKQLEAEKEKFGRFQKNKSEVLRNLQISLNEASLSLDFVSLLATAVRPNVGKTSMSPLLKQHVPIQSLNSDSIVQDDSTNGKLQNLDVNRKALIAWKLESLSNMIELLNTKSDAMASETRKNRIYYRSLFDISCTQTTDLAKHTTSSYEEVLFKVSDKDIGIKYGYQDSGSKYTLDRGVAVLEKSKSGELEFKPLTRVKNGESEVVVRILRTGEETIVVAESLRKSSDDLESNGDGDDDNNTSRVRKEIKKARNRIFEEELFYQLVKESKQLLPHGVKIVSSTKISVELEDEVMEIEFVKGGENDVGDAIEKGGDKDEKNGDTEEKSLGREKKKAGDKRATSVLHLLRLLLCHHHKKQLYESSVGSSNSTSNNANNNIDNSNAPLLLRPIIGQYNHEKFMKKLIKQIILLYDEELKMGISIIEKGKVRYESKQGEAEPQKPLKVKAEIFPQGKSSSEKSEKNHRKQDIFSKIVTPKQSEISITSKTNGNNNIEVLISIATSSNTSFCDNFVIIKIIEANSEIMQVSYSELVEIRHCLRWFTGRYLA